KSQTADENCDGGKQDQQHRHLSSAVVELRYLFIEELVAEQEIRILRLPRGFNRLDRAIELAWLDLDGHVSVCKRKLHENCWLDRAFERYSMKIPNHTDNR